ncbi:hypothetical protein [Candidatus Electronema sp. JC]|uniref:hypothetical protein n=1 Tax=Candidatus Electronema sp. JC TaxID=3401570 RepID=UPI003B42DE72
MIDFAHDFYTELLFYSVTTAGLLWMPFHFGRKMRKRRPLTRRNYIEMSLLCAFTLFMMNIESLPYLLRAYHKFQGVLP